MRMERQCCFTKSRMLSRVSQATPAETSSMSSSVTPMLVRLKSNSFRLAPSQTM